MALASGLSSVISGISGGRTMSDQSKQVAFGLLRLTWTENLSRPEPVDIQGRPFRELVVSMGEHGYEESKGLPVVTPVPTETVTNSEKEEVEATKSLFDLVAAQLEEKPLKLTMLSTQENPKGTTVEVTSPMWRLYINEHGLTPVKGKANSYTVVVGYNRMIAWPMANIIRESLKLKPLPAPRVLVRAFGSLSERRDLNISENALHTVGVNRIKESHKLAIAFRRVVEDHLGVSDLKKIHLAENYGEAQKLHGAARLAIQFPDLELVQRVTGGKLPWSKCDATTTRQLAMAAEDAESDKARKAVFAEAKKFVVTGEKKTKPAGPLSKKELKSVASTEQVEILRAAVKVAAGEAKETDLEIIKVVRDNAHAVNELTFQMVNGNMSHIEKLLEEREARLQAADMAPAAS
jgi:hypothetical protein